MSNEINLAALREHLPPLEEIYRKVANGEANPDIGIYPVVINGECRGLHLGQKTPKDNNSVCFIAGTHQNELGGWAAFRSILERWEKGVDNHPAIHTLRDQLPGDIYLMFSGEKPRVDELFDTLSNPSRSSIPVDEYTRYRERTGGANANRVPLDHDYAALSDANKQLVDDHKAFEEAVFRRCRLVLDLHSMSQEADSVLLPHPSPGLFEGKPLQVQQTMVESVARKYMKLAQNMGVTNMFPHLATDQNDHTFTGTGSSPDTFRALFEGGGPHTDPVIWSRCTQAALGALGTMWDELSYLQPAEKSSPNVFGLCTHFYLPDSPNFHLTPKTALPVHETRGMNAQWSLVTGDEHLPDAVQVKLAEMGLPTQYPQGRLGNGAMLKAKDPIAYACKDGKVSIMVVPPGINGEATMFPCAASGLPSDRIESVGVMAPRIDLRRTTSMAIA